MKTTMIFLSFLVFIAIPANGSDFRERAMNAVKQCIKTLNADEETVGRLLSGKNFLEKKTSCLANCAMEIVGAIKNGKINHKTAANDVIESQKFNDQSASAFRRMVKNCKAVAERSTNKCTVAGEFLYCIKDAITA